MAVIVLVMPGPVMTKATPGLPVARRIAIGHEARALFMARRDVADLRAGEAAVELDRVHAGNAENRIDIIGFEQMDEGFTDSGHADFRCCRRDARRTIPAQAASILSSAMLRLMRR